MIERAIAFGRDGSLTGILAEPDAARTVTGAPAFVMWNVGIHHRVGPYRIQVDIARELARRGFASLRFDVSGMGDSEIRQDGRPDQERALDDVRSAMALLEKRRAVKRFVPVGFCSSVDSVHALALADDRIAGACFIEGYAYRTRGFWVHYPLRLLDTMRWKRRVSRKLPQWFSATLGGRIALDPIEEERAALAPIFARQYPTREQFGQDVHRMVARGARLLFVYVGGDTDFNHAGQFEEMIGGPSLGGRVEIAYYGDADHTFYRVEDRRRTVFRIAEWASTTFLADAPVARRAPTRSATDGSDGDHGRPAAGDT
jgi:hypothetical protein